MKLIPIGGAHTDSVQPQFVYIRVAIVNTRRIGNAIRIGTFPICSERPLNERSAEHDVAGMVAKIPAILLKTGSTP